MSARRTTHRRSSRSGARTSRGRNGVPARVGRHHVAAVAHRVAVLRLLEDLVCLELGGLRRVAGSVTRRLGEARIASRTHRVSARGRAPELEPLLDFGPWPVTTDAARPSRARCSATRRPPRRGGVRVGDGQPELKESRHVDPRGTPGGAPRRLALIRQWRSRSFARSPRGPCICMSGPHQRSSASWTAARWEAVPVIIVTTTSRPCMMWTDSSQQIFCIVRATG